MNSNFLLDKDLYEGNQELSKINSIMMGRKSSFK